MTVAELLMLRHSVNIADGTFHAESGAQVGLPRTGGGTRLSARENPSKYGSSNSGMCSIKMTRRDTVAARATSESTRCICLVWMPRFALVSLYEYDGTAISRRSVPVRSALHESSWLAVDEKHNPRSWMVTGEPRAVRAAPTADHIVETRLASI